MRSTRDILDRIAFGVVRWGFFVLVLALLPVAVGGLDTITRGHHLHFVALFEHGELLLVSAAVVGAALAELISEGDERFRTLRLLVGCTAGTVVIAASIWFADIAARLRDGSSLDDHTVAEGSAWLFAFAVVASLCCLVVAGLAEER